MNESGVIRESSDGYILLSSLRHRVEFNITSLKQSHICNFLLIAINTAQLINNKCAKKKYYFSESSNN